MGTAVAFTDLGDLAGKSPVNMIPPILFLMVAGVLAGSGQLSLGISFCLAVTAIHERRRKTSTPSAPDLRSTNYIKSSAAHSGEHSHG